MKISDIVMKGLEDLDNTYWGLDIPFKAGFFGGILQVIVGFALWITFTVAFFHLIKKSSAKMKEEKLGKDFNLHLRIPIDIRSTPQKIQKYIDTKHVTFHNVEITGHRLSWYHKEPKGEDKIFYTMTMACDMRNGHIHFVHANTEDKKGDAVFTSNFLLKELRDQGLINKKEERYIKKRMGFSTKGGA
jgi:hypothetical protein